MSCLSFMRHYTFWIFFFATLEPLRLQGDVARMPTSNPSQVPSIIRASWMVRVKRGIKLGGAAGDERYLDNARTRHNGLLGYLQTQASAMDRLLLSGA